MNFAVNLHAEVSAVGNDPSYGKTQARRSITISKVLAKHAIRCSITLQLKKYTASKFEVVQSTFTQGSLWRPVRKTTRTEVREKKEGKLLGLHALQVEAAHAPSWWVCTNTSTGTCRRPRYFLLLVIAGWAHCCASGNDNVHLQQLFRGKSKRNDLLSNDTSSDRSANGYLATNITGCSTKLPLIRVFSSSFLWVLLRSKRPPL